MYNICAVVLILLLVTPASLTWMRLMRHSLIPTIQVSNPNGYDDIEAASRLLEASPANANWFDPETASHQQLTRAVTEAASAYAASRQVFAIEYLTQFRTGR